MNRMTLLLHIHPNEIRVHFTYNCIAEGGVSANRLIKHPRNNLMQTESDYFYYYYITSLSNYTCILGCGILMRNVCSYTGLIRSAGGK